MSRPREAALTTRAVRVACIPGGGRADLPAGTPAVVTQALGSSFMLLVERRLVRLQGADADTIGKPAPVLPAMSADAGPEDLRHQVWLTLKTCCDLGIPFDRVFDPRWDRSMMSEAALLALGL